MGIKRLALITARGGSKRIPKKNIREFCGRPIIGYSIQAAKDAGVFDTVMVSTDSEEIAEIAMAEGAEVPFLRSEATSGDFATTADVILEVLTEYEKKGEFFDEVCCIYPTAPFVTGNKLKEAVAILEDKNYDSVMPVTPFSFPPLRGMVMEGDKISYKWEEYEDSRSQDLETIYHDCGQFYVLNIEPFKKTRKMVTKNTGAIEISEMEMQDIDNEIDWKLAELKYELLYGRK
jgi:N-acylneuraminate cytidylyltransferase